MSAKTSKVQIDEYSFDENDNPYENVKPGKPITLTEVAHKIAVSIDTTPEQNRKLLVRGIQSGKHEIKKEQLLARILEESREFENIDDPDTIYAALYEGEATILHILQGFHEYKPKCEERPQFPVDIWLIFDAGAYENIEYLHPRHNVLARDKWKRVQHSNTGLLKIIEIDNNSRPVS